jgi:AmmeMemoRadiSam system protein A
MLTEQQGRILLRLARQQIEKQLGIELTQPVSTDELNEPAFLEKRGVFVTLHKRRELRGCIGSLTAVEPLAEGIQRNALNAAFKDYRFDPLTTDELEDLHIEISVLTDPQPLTYRTADELPLLLRPAIDGVILTEPGGASATFLPQVWQQLPAAEQFLGHLCRKAGLADGAWRSGTMQILTYQVQSFEEPRCEKGGQS